MVNSNSNVVVKIYVKKQDILKCIEKENVLLIKTKDKDRCWVCSKETNINIDNNIVELILMPKQKGGNNGKEQFYTQM